MLKQPKKDAVNPFFKSKYATLDSVVTAIDESAQACGLSYVQMTDIKDGHFGLVTIIMHTGGETINGFYVLPATGKPQEVGSAVSYARRYALSAAFGVVADEDDDGNAAAPVIKPTTPEENKLFDNFKKSIKACESKEALDTFVTAAAGNIAKLPEELKVELRNVVAEKKQGMGA